VVEITNSETLEAWLKGKDRDVAIAIASLAALRVVPSIADHVFARPSGREQTERPSAAIVLPLFRAMAAPWFAAKYPNRGAEVSAPSASPLIIV
jgi:hypothetical protein